LRHPEEVGDGVEAVGRIIRRQKRRDVADVERQQIADRVAILRPVQAMEYRAAGTRRGGGLIETTLEPGEQTDLRSGVGMGNASRRHRARLQLPHNFFPEHRIPGDVLEIDRVEDNA
jgi:hypothetical protein